jgi:hypothetical protein
VWTPKCEGSF